MPAVLGFFEKEGKKYLAVVNNSVKESGQFRIHVPKNVKKFQRWNWNHDLSDMKTDCWDAFYTETEDQCIGGDWLAPGQMKLYHYEV